MKILNLGSLNIDRTYKVEHFVSPKETISAEGYEEFCGGKGLNQSVALARAGAEVYHAGAVGEGGDILLDMLESSGVNTDYILKLDGASGHAVIQVDESGQNSIIIFGGANRRITKEYISDVISRFDSGDIILLQNEISNVDFAMEKAKEKGMVIAYNPSPIDDGVYKCNLGLVDCFIVNEIEGRLLAEIESEEPQDIIKALKEKYENATFVLTLGEKGSFCFDKKDEHFCDIFKVDAVDTTGAGDTFLGYFLASVASEVDITAALKRASAASAIAVTRNGASSSIPERYEVSAFLEMNK